MMILSPLDTVEERIEYYKENAPRELNNEEFIQFLIEKDFFSKPYVGIGSTELSGNLFEHNWNVAKLFRDFTKAYSRVLGRPRTWFLVGMFYNLYLVDCIELKDGKYVLNDDYMLSGVELGERTIAMLSQFYKLTEEEKICIRWHRGTFDKYCNNEEYIEMINECPALYTLHSTEVYISHILDRNRLG